MKLSSGDLKFIQENSPDGGFLQSVAWREFQESFGRKTFNIDGKNFWANIIEHELPIVGKYFYIPRGPVMSVRGQNSNDQTEKSISDLVDLSEKNRIGWIRFDAINSQALNFIQKKWRVKRAPHDMQPREIFMIDITKSSEELLKEMKSKTRYNIKIAQKHDVKIVADRKYLDEFIGLVKITAKRDKITPHQDEYYKKMFEAIPAENMKLYIAEYGNKIVAANINVFYGKVATYLHGASDNDYRNVMAPYLLQWQAISDAKKMGYEKYDFGGVRTTIGSDGWTGITRFKLGFSSTTELMEFPGSYDIIIDPWKYNLYKLLQQIKALF